MDACDPRARDGVLRRRDVSDVDGEGKLLFPHIAGLTSAILGCALLLVSSATMGLAGFLSVQVLTPLAVFFVILAFGVVWMVTKLLRHLAQLQPDATVCRNGKVA